MSSIKAQNCDWILHVKLFMGQLKHNTSNKSNDNLLYCTHTIIILRCVFFKSLLLDSSIVGGKTGKTSVLPGFSKIDGLAAAVAAGQCNNVVVLPSQSVCAAPGAPLESFTM